MPVHVMTLCSRWNILRPPVIYYCPQPSMKSSSETAVRSSGSDRVLVIMAKAPRPGMVKTRLAQSLSPAAVTAFYCCLLEDTLALARSLGDVEEIGRAHV